MRRRISATDLPECHPNRNLAWWQVDAQEPGGEWKAAGAGSREGRGSPGTSDNKGPEGEQRDGASSDGVGQSDRGHHFGTHTIHRGRHSGAHLKLLAYRSSSLNTRTQPSAQAATGDTPQAALSDAAQL